MKTIFLYFLLMTYPGKRQVLVFYNEKGTDLKERQLAELKRDTAGITDRNMEVHTYSTSIAKAEIKKWHIDISKPFIVLLVGKDGGEKLRSDTVITTETFFNTVDAMPMRKREMEER